MKPVVKLLRGLPGSGKSTAVKKFQKELPPGRLAEVCSSDHFFIGPDGVYRFDVKQLSQAHRWCFQKYLDAVRNPLAAAIFIDNTNLRAWEMAPYIAVADAHGLEHEIITHVIDPLTSFRRNVHDVPLATIMSMSRILQEEQLPPFWKHTYVDGGAL